MNIDNRDSIHEVVAKCTVKKPYRAAVVVKTIKMKQALSEIKAALNEREVSFWVINIASLIYMFRVQNGSMIEVIDNSVFKGESHIFHCIADNGDGFRILQLNYNKSEGL